VQLAPASPTSEADLAQHAAQHLAPYKRPSQILLVPSMPLTPTGKVIKGELAKMTQFAHKLTTPPPAARLYSGTSISVGPSLPIPPVAPSRTHPAK
jgi:hypothetical protein